MLKELRALFKRTGRGGEFLLLLLLRAPFDALYTMLQAWFMQNAFAAVGRGDGAGLGAVCLGFGLLSALLFLYNGSVWMRFSAFVARICARVRRLMFASLNEAAPEAIEAKPHSEWMTRLNVDAQLDFLTKPLRLAHAVVAVFGIAVSSAFLLAGRPEAFFWTLLFAAPHLLIGRAFLARPMTKWAEEALSVTADNAADFDAIVACKETAVLYEAEDFLLERFRQSSLRLRRAQMRMRARAALGEGILPLLGWGGYLALIVAGGAWIAQGNYTFGELTAALQYRGRVLAGLLLLANSMAGLRASLAGLRRVNETLALPREDEHNS